MTTRFAEAMAPLLTPTGEPVALERARELGAGGEARVFALGADRVAKVYRDPTPEYARKLAQMLAAPPAIDASSAVRLTWPLEPLVRPDGLVAGYVMARADGARIFEVYNPLTRRALEARFDWGLLHRVGVNVAAALSTLHARGYVVGDVNESNILVAPDGLVTLVDTDGFQVPDPPTGGVFRARVGRPEYTPPELQGVDFGDHDRSELHDRFGLGVLLFLLLMEGTHPFAIRAPEGAEPPPLERRIRLGLYPHHPSSAAEWNILPPRLAPPLGALHPELQRLFARCFADGHRDPGARPAAPEWQLALEAAAAGLTTCAAQPLHRYTATLPGCPWCRRALLLGGRDPFPAEREIPRPRPARVAPEPPLTAPAAPPRKVSVAPPAVRAPQPPGFVVLDPLVWLLPMLTLSVRLPSGGTVALFALMLLIWRAVEYKSRRAWGKVAGVSLAMTMGALMLPVAAPGTGPYVQDPGYSAPYYSSPYPEMQDRSYAPLPSWARVDGQELIPGGGIGKPGANVTEPLLRGLETGANVPELPSGPITPAWVEMTVSGDGIPVPASIVVSGPDDPAIRGTIRELAESLRFEPATREGRQYSARILLRLIIQRE